MRHAIILSTTAFCALLAACASGPPAFPAASPSTGKRAPPIERDFRAADVAKADVDAVAEAHVRECLGSARLLMQKLYRRNPREWRKGNYASMEAAVAHALDGGAQFRFQELGDCRGSDAIMMALKPEYWGDRVFAFGVGLAITEFLPYHGKT